MSRAAALVIAVVVAGCASPLTPAPSGPSTAKSVGLQAGADFSAAGLTRCPNSGDRTGRGNFSHAWSALAAAGAVSAWSELWNPSGVDCLSDALDTDYVFSHVIMFADEAHAAAFIRPLSTTGCHPPQVLCGSIPAGAGGGDVFYTTASPVAYEATWWKGRFAVNFYSQQFSLDQDLQISQNMADRIH